MASLPKNTFTKFVDDWNGRKQWAQSAGIPYSDFAATVHYDYQRMTNSQGFGEKMSDTEAFDAMTALKQGQNPFKTPADATPNFFSNPFGAVRNDVQGIVTGLFHAPQAIYHDFNQAVHGHLGGIASLIPGYTDVTDLFSTQGRQYLSEHPVSDMLDFMGSGAIADLGEAALRNTGATAAADLLHQIPDHPVSKAFKTTFNTAADHIAGVAAIKEFGTKTLGGLGQLPEQKQFILRPFRAAQSLIKQTPFPDYFSKLGKTNLAFGKVPAGEEIFHFMDSKATDMTKPEINTAINMFNHSVLDSADNLSGTFDPTKVISPNDFLDNPAVPDSSKGLYRAFQKASQNLRMAEWVNEHAIKPVYHPITGEVGWTKVDGAWDSYIKKMNRLLNKADSSGKTLGTALQTIHNGLKHLTSDDSGLPQALRLPGDTTVTIPASLRRTADYYRVNAPNLFSRELTSSAARRAQGDFLKSINRVFGADGPMQDLVNRISSLQDLRDGDKIISDIRTIRRSLTRFAMTHDAAYQWLETTLNDIHNTVHNMGIDQRQVGKLRDNYEANAKAAVRVRKSLDYNWNRYTQQAYAAMVQRKLITDLKDYLDSHYKSGEIHAPRRLKGVEITPEQIDTGLREAELGNYGDPSVQLLFPPAEWSRINRDAWLSVNDMKAAGAKPYFVTGVNLAEERSIAEGRYESVTDISHYVHRSVEHERAPVLTSTIFNPVYGIPKEAIGIYRQQLVHQVLNHFVNNVVYSNQDIVTWARQEAETRLGSSHPALTDTKRVVEDYATRHGYVAFDPSNPLGLTLEKNLNSSTGMWIKTYNAKLLRSTVKEMDRSINKAYDSVMQVYRFGVLYASPRYAAHITLGGGLMTELRLIHPIMTPIKYGRQAWQMAANVHSYGVLVSRGVAEQDARGALVSDPFRDQITNPRTALLKNPEATHHFLVGRKLAQLYHEARSSRLGTRTATTLESYKELLEHVSNFQRSLALIEGEEHAITHPSELTPAIRAEATRWNTTPEKYYGATLARKTLADMQVVSPMERSIIMRYVMPFWGWTRHIIRYVGTYPADHPLRASIIQSVSNQAIGENSNLPEYLFRLLFLGQPNAQGNVTVLDDRQWNPFRDIANYMTWGGIMSNLNPVLQAITASAWGVNSATGGPDLFPQLTFDSFYGSESAAPTGGNFFVDIAKQISPQIDTLLEVTKSTSSLREEAAAHPGTLGYLIGDSMGLPWIPERLNVKQIQIKGTTDEEVLASGAVQQALQSNSMAPLQGYSGLLPLSGYEVDKNYISQLIQQALVWNKQNPQGNGVQISALDLLSLPYASQYAPEVLLGGQSNDS